MSSTMSSFTTQPPSPPGDEVAAALCQLQGAVAVLVAAEPTRATVEALGDHLVGLQAQLNTVTGVAARWAQVFGDAGGHEQAGSATVAAWMRQHLHLAGSESRRRVQAGRALACMPRLRQAWEDGLVGVGQVDAVTVGLKQLGPDVLEPFEELIVAVAVDCDADAVRDTISKLRDRLDPDAADAAYLHALEHRDVQVSPVGDGYALNGYLDPDTGAMLTQVLYAGAKPVDKDDDRSAGQRRVDALNTVCRSLLDHGLPTDRGLRPHLFVTVTADHLNTITATPPGTSPGTRTESGEREPAVLEGFGPISDLMLSKLACDCEVTPVLVDSNAPYPNVLDVGHTQRLATLKQRQAIRVQQGGQCFSPGCNNTHLEIHHMKPWSLGGPTNLVNLRGYCTRCHHLIHLGLLTVRPDSHGGWTHHTKNHRQLLDRRRRTHRINHRYLRALLRGGHTYATEELRRWTRGQPTQPPP